MGGLLSFLGKSDMQEVFIDLENALPTANEAKLHSRIEELLSNGEPLLQAVADFKGCSSLIRDAMTARTKDLSAPPLQEEEDAFVELLNSVDLLLQLWKHAKGMEESVRDILLAISGPMGDSKGEDISGKQALCKQLADMLDFSLRLDTVRMGTPQLANDFSFYRRTLPKFKKKYKQQITVTDDDASAMQLFTAQPTPMITALIAGAKEAEETNTHVTTSLSIMANSCMSMVKNHKFDNPATDLLCARAMVGSIVLFDHVDPMYGAFHKKSPIAAKACIQLLLKQFPTHPEFTGAIQFSTKTFQTAPDSIQDLLA